jgi:ubiquitin C-terminal hydrolase
MLVGDRVGTPHPVDWPRGLNQLGNTCYLNSLRMFISQYPHSVLTS